MCLIDIIHLCISDWHDAYLYHDDASLYHDDASLYHDDASLYEDGGYVFV